MPVYQKTMFDRYYCIKSFCHLKTLEKRFEMFIFVRTRIRKYTMETNEKIEHIKNTIKC